ncbi:MAG: hypothetical protein KDD43_14205, partial [Bdellovibrionales bacterium]|nr:hypothetical protein [Bdellovibrionales bacterium]
MSRLVRFVLRFILRFPIHFALALVIVACSGEFNPKTLEEMGLSSEEGEFLTFAGNSVQVVGIGPEDGFFSLKEFKGKLVAGGFGYQGKNKIMTFPPWREQSPGIRVRESVCALEDFNGYLYANTESDGQIYRSSDGAQWTKVFDGPNPVGCGLAVFNGYIYALNSHYERPSGQIYRSKDGLNWEKVYDGGSRTLYIREIRTYNNKLYAFGVYRDTNDGGMFTSTDGKNWTWKSYKTRFFRSHVYNGFLWLASSADYSAGNESAIWKFDGTNLSKVYATRNMSHISNIIDYN